MITRGVTIRRVAGKAEPLGLLQGEAVAAEIERVIETAAGPTVLWLDFSGTRCAALSCLRAIVRAVGARSEGFRPSCSPVLRLDSSARDLIDTIVLLLHGARQAMLAVYEDDSWEVLGALTLTDRRTLDVLMVRESITSAELALLFGIRINAASTRLKRLYDKGLAARCEMPVEEAGGRRFIYQRLHAGRSRRQA